VGGWSRSTVSAAPPARLGQTLARHAQRLIPTTLVGYERHPSSLQPRSPDHLDRQAQDPFPAARRHRPLGHRHAASGRLQPDRKPRGLTVRRRTAPEDRRCALRRHPFAHPAHGRGAGPRAQADRHRLLLHRHQPGRSGGGAPARHCGVQRTVLQHPVGGRTGAGRSHPAAARRARKEHGGPPRWLAQDRPQRPRDSRQDAGHRGLRRHRLAAVGAGRSAGHAGGVCRRAQQTAAGQCWAPPTW